MRIVLVLTCSILLTLPTLSQITTGAYKTSGQQFSPTLNLYFVANKTITQIGPNTYNVSRFGPFSNTSFQFKVDANNNLYDLVATGLPAGSDAGFMTLDNPGHHTFPDQHEYSPGVAPYLHSTYNNKYDPVKKMFYMHYGYGNGATSQNDYSRQTYEAFSLFRPADIISVSPLTGTAFSEITIKGKNFDIGTSVFVRVGNIEVDSFVVVSDSLITAWLGGGAPGNLVVTNHHGGDTLVGFTYIPTPEVKSHKWTYVGNAGFSQGAAQSVSAAISPNNTPYVVYVDSPGARTIVKRFVSNMWEQVGPAVSPGKSTNCRITFDSAGIPIVAFIDSLNGNKISINKFNGASWTQRFVDEPPTTFPIVAFTIAIDRNNKIYLVVMASQAVYAYDETSTGWNSVVIGNAPNEDPTNISIVLDKDQIPYAAWSNMASNEQTFFVKKFVSGSWNLVGDPIPGPGYRWSSSPTIKIDNSGSIYVAFRDANSMIYERGNIYKLIGNTWTPTAEKFTKARVWYPQFVMDKTNKQYFAYIDRSYNLNGTVKVSDGNLPWDTAGRKGIIPTKILHANSMLIDSTNRLLLAFSDIKNGGKASLMIYNDLCYSNVNTWTGAINNQWSNPGNWACGSVPQMASDVVINAGAVIVLSSNTTINTLTLHPGASFTIAGGVILTILN